MARKQLALILSHIKLRSNTGKGVLRLPYFRLQAAISYRDTAPLHRDTAREFTRPVDRFSAKRLAVGDTLADTLL
jgi:hypothetical protein